MTGSPLPTPFNYAAPAQLLSRETDPEQFMRKGWKTIQPLGFGQFARAADALRYAVEELAPELREAAYMDVGGAVFDCAAMKALYDDSRYPWPRVGHLRQPTPPPRRP